MIFQKALITQILLQTDEVQQWFKTRRFGEALIRSVMPLLQLVLSQLQ
jgi:hypothetical protein